MKRMADLVDGLLFTLPQRAAGQKGILFKKETDFIAGIQEVVIGQTRLFVGRKNRSHAGRIEISNQLCRSISQAITGVFVDKVFEQQETISIVLLKLFFSSAHFCCSTTIPRLAKSAKNGVGVKHASGAITPVRSTSPRASFWAAIDKGMPVIFAVALVPHSERGG